MLQLVTAQQLVMSTYSTVAAATHCEVCSWLLATVLIVLDAASAVLEASAVQYVLSTRVSTAAALQLHDCAKNYVRTSLLSFMVIADRRRALRGTFGFSLDASSNSTASCSFNESAVLHNSSAQSATHGCALQVAHTVTIAWMKLYTTV